MKRLAIITTHPIQYNAPWFKLLSQRKNIHIKVFYTWGQIENTAKFDPGFGKEISWDIPLLEGYEYTFVTNTSKDPGSHHFNGIINPSLVDDIESWNADAILIFGWSFKSHLKVLRYFKGKKTNIFRGDSNLLDESTNFSPKKLLRKIFLKWVYSYVDSALFVGSLNKAYYLKYGLNEKQLSFAPHAVDNNRFGKEVEVNEKISYFNNNDATVFLFTGKFEPKKDPLLLLKCFISMNNTKTRLLFVGNGILENELKEIVSLQSFALQERIQFLPFQNQIVMPAIYRIADVVVLPSQGPSETWGLSINEAMASSRAVLVSDKCGCAIDLVKDDFNGFIFKHNNKDDLMEKMKNLSSNKNRLSVMGNNSLRIINDWNYDNICTPIESILE